MWMGRAMGFEPTTLWTTTRCSNQLSYARHARRIVQEDVRSSRLLFFCYHTAVPVPSFHITCTKKELIAPGVYELTFTKPKDLSFKPGQFVLFDVPLIDHPEDIQTRAFSIASRPEEPHLFFLIKLVPGGRASRWIEQVVTDGTSVRIQGPFGNFVIDHTTQKEFLFIATGTGVAPFLPQIESILLSGETRRIDLVFGVRTEEDLFWIDRWRTLASQYPNFHVHLSLSNPTKNDPSWHSGRIQQMIPMIIDSLSEKNIYICGSPDMTKELKSLCLESWNIPKKDIHVEGYI